MAYGSHVGAAMAPRQLEVRHNQLIDHGLFADGQYHFAVIDIGSNSVRLVVYDDLSRAPYPRFNEKSLCGLGEGLNAEGMLSAHSIDLTVRAVNRFCAIARAMNVDRIDVFATEAVRRANNGADLVAAIQDHSGLHVRILSGTEEATYSAFGVVSGFFKPSGVAGDLGGGSLEVADIYDDSVGELAVSMPLGALPVSAMMADGVESAIEQVDKILHKHLPALLRQNVFYAIGGGWRAFARVHIALKKPPIGIVHGYEIGWKEARSFAGEIMRMAPGDVANLHGMPSRRAANMPAAALVLDRLLKILKPESVVFSALGLREGWLYAQLPPEERQRDPLIEGAKALALPTARVAEFGATLVRWTDSLFPSELAEERRLRTASCILSDISWRDHPAVRASESFRRLVAFPFVGVTHEERAYIGAVVYARHRGKSDDPVLGPAKRLLTGTQRRKATILGRAMSLGYRLSGSVPDILDGTRLRIGSDAVRLEVDDADQVPDSDAVRTRLRQFAKTAGLSRAEICVGDAPVIDSIDV